MSQAIIRKLLETRLNAMSPALPTAFENVPYAVVARTADQRVQLLMAAPDHPTMGALNGSGTALRRESGILQVTLHHPENAGPAPTEARLALLTNQFYRGLVLAEGAVRLVIDTSPSAGPGRNEGGFYVVPVSIGFYADVYS